MPRAAARHFAALIAAVAIAGCGDSTGPRDRTPALTLSGPTQLLVEVGSYPDGTPRVECSAQMWARTTGKRDVLLDSGRVHFYGLSGNVDMGSDALSHAEIAELFGGDRVQPKGDGLTTYLRMWSPQLFRVTLDVFYHPQGSLSEHVSHSAQCGNSPPAGQVGVSPTVTAVSIVPVGGGSVDALQPGDLIDVTYTATAPAGATRILLRWDGSRAAPLESHGQWATTLTRTTRMQVPALAALDGPTALRVIVVDDAENSGSAAFPPVTLHDLKKPAGDLMMVPMFQVGDSVRLDIRAADNDEVQAVVVRWGAPLNIVDSIPVEDSTVFVPWRRAVPADWARTAAPLTVTLYDKAGNSTQLASSRVVSFYQALSRPVVSAAWTGGSRFTGPVVDVKRGLLYFAIGDESRLRVISLADGSERAQVSLPATVRGFDITPGGDSLVLGFTDRAALGIVDLAHGNATSEVPLMDVTADHPAYVHQMVVLSPSRVLAIVSGSPYAAVGGTVLELDLATGQQRLRADAAPIPYESPTLARSGDRSAAFMQPSVYGTGCVQRYDAASGGFAPCLTYFDFIGRPSVDAAGRLLLGNRYVYDATTLDTVSSIALPNRYGESVIAPDGTVSYVGVDGGYFVVRTSDGTVREKIAFPGWPDRTTVSPDGRWLIGVAYAKLMIVDLAAAAAPVVARSAGVATRTSAAVASPARPATTRRSTSPPNDDSSPARTVRRTGIERLPR